MSKAQRRALWPPRALRLPDTTAAIEAGRQGQRSLLPPEPVDDSREARLARLLGIPGVGLAVNMGEANQGSETVRFAPLLGSAAGGAMLPVAGRPKRHTHPPAV